MIRLVEALNFRCLRYVHQSLDSFHVLVGPNASGKSTFLDAVAFLGDLVSNRDDVSGAVARRTPNYQDLFWQRSGTCFELALALAIPEGRQAYLPNGNYDLVRSKVRIGSDEQTSEISILAEKVLLKRIEKKSE